MHRPSPTFTSAPHFPPAHPRLQPITLTTATRSNLHLPHRRTINIRQQHVLLTQRRPTTPHTNTSCCRSPFSVVATTTTVTNGSTTGSHSAAKTKERCNKSSFAIPPSAPPSLPTTPASPSPTAIRFPPSATHPPSTSHPAPLSPPSSSRAPYAPSQEPHRSWSRRAVLSPAPTHSSTAKRPLQLSRRPTPPPSSTSYPASSFKPLSHPRPTAPRHTIPLPDRSLHSNLLVSLSVACRHVLYAQSLESLFRLRSDSLLPHSRCVDPVLALLLPPLGRDGLGQIHCHQHAGQLLPPRAAGPAEGDHTDQVPATYRDGWRHRAQRAQRGRHHAQPDQLVQDVHFHRPLPCAA